MYSAGHEPRNPPPAAAAGGAPTRQALPPLGLYPGPGATAVAPGEYGGHDHGVEQAKPLKPEILMCRTDAHMKKAGNKTGVSNICDIAQSEGVLIG
jgi:hypothetical protein